MAMHAERMSEGPFLSSFYESCVIIIEPDIFIFITLKEKHREISLHNTEVRFHKTFLLANQTQQHTYKSHNTPTQKS